MVASQCHFFRKGARFAYESGTHFFLPVDTVSRHEISLTFVTLTFASFLDYEEILPLHVSVIEMLRSS